MQSKVPQDLTKSDGNMVDEVQMAGGETQEASSPEALSPATVSSQPLSPDPEPVSPNHISPKPLSPDPMPASPGSLSSQPASPRPISAPSKPSLTASSQSARSPAGPVHGLFLGMGVFALGTALAVAVYVWAFIAFHSTDRLSGDILTRPATDYYPWLGEKLLFLLVLLLMSFAGWLVAGQGGKLYSQHCTGKASGLGMAVGLLVFCGGVGLMVLVFMTAKLYFGTAPSQVPLPPANGSTPPDYISWALGGLFQILVLGVMLIIGSLVAGRGIQLFLGSFSRRSATTTI